MLYALSRKWASMECQQLLGFHYNQLQCDVGNIVYRHGFDWFGMLRCSRILSGRSVIDISCYSPGGCGGNILYISAQKGCHILLYGCLWSSDTQITEDARPYIVTLRWRSFPRWELREHLTCFCAIKAANTLVMTVFDLSHPQIAQDTRPTIVDAPLRLIFRMW